MVPAISSSSFPPSSSSSFFFFFFSSSIASRAHVGSSKFPFSCSFPSSSSAYAPSSSSFSVPFYSFLCANPSPSSSSSATTHLSSSSSPCSSSVSSSSLSDCLSSSSYSPSSSSSHSSSPIDHIPFSASSSTTATNTTTTTPTCPSSSSFFPCQFASCSFLPSSSPSPSSSAFSSSFSFSDFPSSFSSFITSGSPFSLRHFSFSSSSSPSTCVSSSSSSSSSFSLCELPSCFSPSSYPSAYSCSSFSFSSSCFSSYSSGCSSSSSFSSSFSEVSSSSFPFSFFPSLPSGCCSFLSTPTSSYYSSLSLWIASSSFSLRSSLSSYASSLFLSSTCFSSFPYSCTSSLLFSWIYPCFLPSFFFLSPSITATAAFTRNCFKETWPLIYVICMFTALVIRGDPHADTPKYMYSRTQTRYDIYIGRKRNRNAVLQNVQQLVLLLLLLFLSLLLLLPAQTLCSSSICPTIVSVVAAPAAARGGRGMFVAAAPAAAAAPQQFLWPSAGTGAAAIQQLLRGPAAPLAAALSNSVCSADSSTCWCKSKEHPFSVRYSSNNNTNLGSRCFHHPSSRCEYSIDTPTDAQSLPRSSSSCNSSISSSTGSSNIGHSSRSSSSRSSSGSTEESVATAKFHEVSTTSICSTTRLRERQQLTSAFIRCNGDSSRESQSTNSNAQGSSSNSGSCDPTGSSNDFTITGSSHRRWTHYEKDVFLNFPSCPELHCSFTSRASSITHSENAVASTAPADFIAYRLLATTTTSSLGPTFLYILTRAVKEVSLASTFRPSMHDGGAALFFISPSRLHYARSPAPNTVIKASSYLSRLLPVSYSSSPFSSSFFSSTAPPVDASLCPPAVCSPILFHCVAATTHPTAVFTLYFPAIAARSIPTPEKTVVRSVSPKTTCGLPRTPACSPPPSGYFFKLQAAEQEGQGRVATAGATTASSLRNEEVGVVGGRRIAATTRFEDNVASFASAVRPALRPRPCPSTGVFSINPYREKRKCVAVSGASTSTAHHVSIKKTDAHSGPTLDGGGSATPLSSTPSAAVGTGDTRIIFSKESATRKKIAKAAHDPIGAVAAFAAARERIVTTDACVTSAVPTTASSIPVMADESSSNRPTPAAAASSRPPPPLSPPPAASNGSTLAASATAASQAVDAATANNAAVGDAAAPHTGAVTPAAAAFGGSIAVVSETADIIRAADGGGPPAAGGGGAAAAGGGGAAAAAGGSDAAGGADGAPGPQNGSVPATASNGGDGGAAAAANNETAAAATSTDYSKAATASAAADPAAVGGDTTAANAATAADLFSVGLNVSMVEEVLRNARPYLQSHGGDVKVVDVDAANNIVRLAFKGACVRCPFSQQTLYDGLQNALREVWPMVTVEEAPVDDWDEDETATVPAEEAQALDVATVEKALEGVMPAINKLGGVLTVVSVSEVNLSIIHALAATTCAAAATATASFTCASGDLVLCYTGPNAQIVQIGVEIELRDKLPADQVKSISFTSSPLTSSSSEASAAEPVAPSGPTSQQQEHSQQEETHNTTIAGKREYRGGVQKARAAASSYNSNPTEDDEYEGLEPETA